MQDYDKTTYFTGTAAHTDALTVTIFDGNTEPRPLRLDEFQQNTVSFGRDPGNDIVLKSNLVSSWHGRFAYQEGKWYIQDRAVYAEKGSSNGLICNDRAVRSQELSDGSFIRIDDGVEPVPDGVLFVFSLAGSGSQWQYADLSERKKTTVGRSDKCDIVLPHVSVSKCHARILCEPDGVWIADNRSTNGVLVNNRRIAGKEKLREKDVITITNARLIFTGKGIFYCCYKSGISVDAENVVITRGKGKKTFVTGDHISMNIRPGELVAIVGGSGAGKSTILNCLCGYLAPEKGEVYINGVNLYQNFDFIKKMIGYVPQSDIVYDNLTITDMLTYTAKLRLPRDTSAKERKAAVERAIGLVELEEKKGSYIRALSGGQKKRASIAVELLSDPNLLFLDEPASGLDPGTERSLMCSLREMADGGKTIILVTHSTLQLRLCDKIAFMGKGGRLCFFGSCEEALEFFGVSDVVDIYAMITDEAEKWRDEYDRSRPPSAAARQGSAELNTGKNKEGLKLPVLCSRYLKLIVNDRQRLFLLLAQAPVLALLIALVADGNQFDEYGITRSLLFALSCSAFWIGILNAIQEVCKERSILKREYMTGLSLNSYIVSKILVLGVMCLIQSGLLIGVFAAVIGLPEEGLLLSPFAELCVTAFLTALASAAMGLFVSSLFTNADRAMTVAPILLMPQILFSGLIFTLEGATKLISWLTVCRWSMEGFGTTAALNSLRTKSNIPRMNESFYEWDDLHMLSVWGILLLFIAAFLLLARFVLSSIGKEKS